ncbi:hypothetical protein QL285_015316 [Trifolium repens]|nr:hypothetical protein QL285_015316 [Trifolium repens]
MVAFRRVLRRPILGGFEKIHFQGLDYGEVEPNFVEEFEDELNYEWEIIKANGSSNFITFNGNLIRPMLTIGWNNLRNSLPPSFHDFLWEYEFSYLTLWGDGGTQTICKIEFMNDQSAYSKLGKNWEEFCVANGFNMGDKLRFKFFDRCFSEHVCVYKLNP